jgi:uncharacterized lipoprotein YmbA
MIGRYRRFALAWFISVCAGCMSAPIRYYTLTAPPDKTMPGSPTTFAIDVRMVHTSPQLGRSALMVRTGPAEMTLLDNERWASPVSDEINAALRLQLQRRLYSVPGLHPGPTRLALALDVQQFEAEPGRYALLKASWSATLLAAGEPSTAARAITCTFQAEEPVRAGYAGIVEGYQREIAALANSIVAALTNSVSTDASCQKSIEDH